MMISEKAKKLISEFELSMECNVDRNGQIDYFWFSDASREALEAYIAKLEAENARLKYELDGAEKDADHDRDAIEAAREAHEKQVAEIERLTAENARLQSENAILRACEEWFDIDDKEPADNAIIEATDKLYRAAYDDVGKEFFRDGSLYYWRYLPEPPEVGG